MYSAIQQYQKIMIETSSPLANIVLLYKKCLQHLRRAEESMHKKNIAAKGEAILRAIDILTALDENLDFSEGEIAEQLHVAYQTMLAHLTQANLKNDVVALRNVYSWVQQLQETWQTLEEQANDG